MLCFFWWDFNKILVIWNTPNSPSPLPLQNYQGSKLYQKSSLKNDQISQQNKSRQNDKKPIKNPSKMTTNKYLNINIICQN